jgi:hypothetical protein
MEVHIPDERPEQDLVTIQVRVPKHAAAAVRAILDAIIIPPGSSESVVVAAFAHVQNGMAGSGSCARGPSARTRRSSSARRG